MLVASPLYGMEMKKILCLVFIVFSININSQSKISLSVLGGYNYIPMENFSHYLNGFSNSDFDKFSFSGNFKLQYNLEDRHNIFLSSEFISTNASFSGGFVSVIWTFEAIPVTIGYEYMFKNSDTDWTPYLGLGISYVLTNTEDKYLGDDGTSVTNYKENTFGFETKIGIEKVLIENLFLVSEIKYRFIGDTKLNKYTNGVETNLSGVCFLIGLKLAVL